MRKEKLFQAFLSLALILPVLAAAQDQWLPVTAVLTFMERLVFGVFILLCILVPIYLVSVFWVLKRKPKTEEETGQENVAASALNEAVGQHKGGVVFDLSHIDSLSGTDQNGEPHDPRNSERRSGCLRVILLTALFAFLFAFLSYVGLMVVLSGLF